MKLLVELVLDSNKPYDKLVFDLLEALPSQSSQREFLISAALYYSKSPAYLTDLKMTEFLGKLEGLEAMLNGTTCQELEEKLSRLAGSQEELISQVSDAVARSVSDSLEGMDLAARASPGSKKARPKEFVDMPEEALSAMGDVFST